MVNRLYRHILDWFRNLWQSLVNNSKSYKYRHKTMIWNIINLGRTQREIHIYSSKLIIVKMTFQLRRFDSSYRKKPRNLKSWKEHTFKELSEPRSNNALEINYHMSQLSKIKDTKKYLKRHPTNYQRGLQKNFPARNEKGTEAKNGMMRLLSLGHDRSEYDQTPRCDKSLTPWANRWKISLNLFFNMNPLGAYFINESHDP